MRHFSFNVVNKSSKMVRILYTFYLIEHNSTNYFKFYIFPISRENKSESIKNQK